MKKLNELNGELSRVHSRCQPLNILQRQLSQTVELKMF